MRLCCVLLVVNVMVLPASFSSSSFIHLQYLLYCLKWQGWNFRHSFSSQVELSALILLPEGSVSILSPPWRNFQHLFFLLPELWTFILLSGAIVSISKGQFVDIISIGSVSIISIIIGVVSIIFLAAGSVGVHSPPWRKCWKSSSRKCQYRLGLSASFSSRLTNSSTSSNLSSSSYIRLLG